jgi:uncharacterized membrane protein YphA (DoxX/SURF4 family)
MNTWIMAIIRVSLAIVLAYAGISKLAAGRSENTIYGRSPRWVQQTLPVGECCVAIWLLSGIYSRAAAVTIVCLLSLFSGLIALELGRPKPVPCGCGLAVVTESGAARGSLLISLSINISLMVAGGFMFLFGDKPVRSPAKQTEQLRTIGTENAAA